MASDYVQEILNGFSRGWNCLVGTARRRAAFRKRLGQIRARPRRWIYLATEKYAAIRRASLSPVALRSEEARDALVTGLCTRSSVSGTVSRSEIKALRQLDLPYFLRKTNEPMPADNNITPADIVEAIRSALRGNRAEVE
jgi:lantibiotic modifying enzyme